MLNEFSPRSYDGRYLWFFFFNPFNVIIMCRKIVHSEMVENRALFNVIGDHCQLPDHLLWMRFTVHHKNYLLQLNINDSFTCFLKKKALFAFCNFIVNGLAYVSLFVSCLLTVLSKTCHWEGHLNTNAFDFIFCYVFMIRKLTVLLLCVCTRI